MDLVARVNEVLQTGLELVRRDITRRALLLHTPLVQVLQVTVLVTSEIRALIRRVLGVRGLSRQRLALVEVGLSVIPGDTRPVLLNLFQLQNLPVRRLNQVMIDIVLMTLRSVNVIHIDNRRSLATQIIVTGVKAVEVRGRNLIQKNKTVRSHAQIAYSQSASRFTFHFGEHNVNHSLIACQRYTLPFTPESTNRQNKCKNGYKLHL